MASLSELAGVLQTSPQEAFRQEDIAQQRYQLQQQAIQDASQDMAPTKPAPLAGMAKGTLPNGYTLQTPDGGFTASGLFLPYIPFFEPDWSLFCIPNL